MGEKSKEHEKHKVDFPIGPLHNSHAELLVLVAWLLKGPGVSTEIFSRNTSD
jgi:hypothetical protein